MPYYIVARRNLSAAPFIKFDGIEFDTYVACFEHRVALREDKRYSRFDFQIWGDANR